MTTALMVGGPADGKRIELNDRHPQRMYKRPSLSVVDWDTPVMQPQHIPSEDYHYAGTWGKDVWIFVPRERDMLWAIDRILRNYVSRGEE